VVDGLNLDAELTHAALHRLLSHALLFRPLLRNQPFVGLIGCRDVQTQIKRLFGIEETVWYGVKGEKAETGIVETEHWPDGFNDIERGLTVPFPGALFLVGAGVFGKVYCHWIKQRGGIAVDIGSIFDSWAKVGRVGHPVRSLDMYKKIPEIAKRDAVRRYNDLLQVFNLDVPTARPLPELPNSW